MINYTTIDLETFPRKAHLKYFMGMQYPQAGITVNVDVTDLKAFCKQEDCSFFLAFLHVVALSADQVPQLRQRIHRTSPTSFEIREYSESPTSHTESCGNDLYCYCTNRHHMPWKQYIEEATERQRKARLEGSLEEDPEIEAFYFPTCSPWMNYTHMTHPVEGPFDSNPRISWGKFEPDFRGRLMMPLTLQCHHGLVDGIHIAKFLKNVEDNMAALVEGRLEY